MGDSVKLGVIGLGNIGQQHINQLRTAAVHHCQLTAVAARNPTDAALSLASNMGATLFRDYRELVDSGLCDAVLVATPTMSHHAIGEYALGKGLHVLMEKPLGLSVLEGEQLLAMATHDQVFALMLNQRVAPVFTAMKAQLDAGVLGEIQRTHWTMTNWFRPEVYFQVSDWRATWRGEGGGLLLNQCIHNLDIFQWLCGQPDRVQGFCSFGKYHAIEVEDEATAWLHYGNGASGVFIGSTGEAPGVNRLDIVGDKGMLSYDGARLQLVENLPGTAEYNRTTRDMFGQPGQRTTELTPAGQVNQHALLIQNFIDAVLHGEKLIAPASEGINSLALANAILWSAWTGEQVNLPLASAAYQVALEQKLAGSTLREKAAIEAHVDMDKSYR